MSSPIDDLKRAAEMLRRPTVSPAQFDSVENSDGLAVFRRAGRVVGWMNWADFEALCVEMEARQ